MTWNYNMPAIWDVDRVRRLVGDTISSDPLQQDEEILDALILEGNPSPQTVASGRTVLYRASANVAKAIAGVMARRVTTQSSGELSKSYSDQYKHYSDLATALLCTANTVGIAPRVGGLSVGAKLSSRDDTDLVQPFFARDMDLNPGGQDVGEDDLDVAELAP